MAPIENTPTVVRQATLGDAPALFQLYVAGWQHHYQDIVAPAFLADMPNNTRSLLYLQALLQPTRADAAVMLAEAAGVIQGFIAVGHTRDSSTPNMAEIYALYINPAAQARGLGYQLFKAVQPHLLRHNFTELHVWTFAKNTQAQRAYRRWGGVQRTEPREIVVSGETIPEVGFIWSLP